MVMHKVTELLMTFWKVLFEKARDSFCGAAEEVTPPKSGPYRSEPKPPVEKPVEAKPAEEKPVEAKPEDKPTEDKPKLLKDGSKLICTLSNEGSRSKSQLDEIKKKTRRRAIRHFEGKEVKHRVTEKKPDSIEFAFFRRSGNPVKVRWQKIGARTEQTPASNV
jgi:hypothetical protein